MSSFIDETDPVKKALPVGIALVVAITLVGAVYFLAEYRSTSKAAVSHQNIPTLAPPPAQPEPAEVNGLEGILTKRGFLVTGLDGPGRGLGLQAGDLVAKVNDRPVVSQMDLIALTPGATIQAEREGEVITLKAGRNTGLVPADVRTIDARGLTGQLTPEGLWVTSAEGDAAAWGLRPGDLVRTVDGNALTVRRDATTRLRMLNARDGFVFEIVRDGARLFLPYGNASNGLPQGIEPGAQAAAPAAAAGLVQGAINPGPPACAGVTCPYCGTFHQPGWHRGNCLRCGQPLPGSACGPAPMIPRVGAGVAAQAAPVGPCGQTPRRFNEGWAGGFGMANGGQR